MIGKKFRITQKCLNSTLYYNVKITGDNKITGRITYERKDGTIESIGKEKWEALTKEETK